APAAPPAEHRRHGLEQAGMPLLRNPMHERFAQEIANGRSLVDAYKAASFKPDFRLRDRKDIGQRVDQIMTDRERRATLSTERAIEKAAIHQGRRDRNADRGSGLSTGECPSVGGY